MTLNVPKLQRQTFETVIIEGYCRREVSGLEGGLRPVRAFQDGNFNMGAVSSVFSFSSAMRAARWRASLIAAVGAHLIVAGFAR